MPEWERVPLGEVIELKIDAVPVDPSATYNISGVYSFGRGLIARGPLPGSETTYKVFHRLHTDDFVLSQLKAWEGALARVTPEFDGWFLSPQFPTFRVKPELLDIGYLELYCKQESVWNELRGQARGMGARRDSVNPARFLALEIPLPPLPEQKRIVARVKSLLDKVEEARRLREATYTATESLLTAELHNLFTENHHAERQVGGIAEIIDPNPSHRMPQYAEQGIPFISTVDFSGNEGINRRTKKYVSRHTYEEQVERCRFSKDDILYCRIGSIGKSRLLSEIWEFALSHVLVVVKPNSEVVYPRYLLWYLRSDAIVTQATEATRSMGVPDLGIKRIREFKIPLPPMPQQIEVANRLDDLQEKIDGLRHLQNPDELQALPASILAQAFAGAL